MAGLTDAEIIGGYEIDPESGERIRRAAPRQLNRRSTDPSTIEDRLRQIISNLEHQAQEIQNIELLPNPADQVGTLRMSKLRADLEAVREPLMASITLLTKQVPPVRPMVFMCGGADDEEPQP